MIEDLQKYNNDIPELNKIDFTRYENIFQVAKNGDYYFYNIIKKIKFPDDIDKRFYDEVVVDIRAPYTTLSYKYYGTQDLWWLVCLTNSITNPVSVLEPGSKLKILKTSVVNSVLSEIDSKLKQ